MENSERAAVALWRFNAFSNFCIALVVALVIVFAAMRFIGMFGGTSLRWVLPLSFILMMAMPWLLLSQAGRRQIGLQKPTRSCYLLAMALGALAAGGCFALGIALFGTGADNWFISISNNYRSTMNTNGFPLWKLHLIFTLPALLFSPIGEELFFRGLLQRSLEERLSARASTVIECSAFGLVHLCHHGILATAAGLIFLPVSGVIWATLMFFVAFLFAWLRQRSGSLYTAMASHAAFNLSMNVLIFAFLW
jgi:uncharacterized protein